MKNCWQPPTRQMACSCKKPMQEPAGCCIILEQPFAENRRSGDRCCPPHCSNRAGVPASLTPPLGAMRSGPSAAATSCSTLRQRKRRGGPSGTSASVSMGWGGWNNCNGRFWPSSSIQSAEAAGEATATAPTARNGSCVSRATKRTTRAGPKRVVRRSMSSASALSSFTLPSSPRCCSRKGSERVTARRSASKPKPGSRGSATVSMRSVKSRIRLCASRVARAVSIASRRTLPSLRKKLASNRRPPAPWAAIISTASRHSSARIAARLSIKANGSANWRSTTSSARGRSGVMRTFSRPRIRESLVTIAWPKRAASTCGGRAARSPIRRKPARVRAVVVSESIPMQQVAGAKRCAHLLPVE